MSEQVVELLVGPEQDGERLDVAAPLITTPQQARQRRFEVQGARTAGLFARRRPGAKPGY